MNVNDVLALIRAGYTKDEIAAMTTPAADDPKPAPAADDPKPAPVADDPKPAPVADDPKPAPAADELETRMTNLFDGFMQQLQSFARGNDEANGKKEKTVDDMLNEYLSGKRK